MAGDVVALYKSRPLISFEKIIAPPAPRADQTASRLTHAVCYADVSDIIDGRVLAVVMRSSSVAEVDVSNFSVIHNNLRYDIEAIVEVEHGGDGRGQRMFYLRPTGQRAF